jgi:hypothetical protein
MPTPKATQAVEVTGNPFERWPGYDEQSWQQRFLELDRRYLAATKQFQDSLTRLASTPAAAEIATGAGEGFDGCALLAGSLGPDTRVITREQFAALSTPTDATAVEAEREACAKICDAEAAIDERARQACTDPDEQACYLWARQTSERNATAIRARAKES